ncbi:Alpha/Beta hydrolase protein [Mrakia frigida]|uniref:Alpha/Beta hydrolase protein n=1 Tax=Mrakia frigida TaxID=29902 RepID=UPI003FCC1D25
MSSPLPSAALLDLPDERHPLTPNVDSPPPSLLPPSKAVPTTFGSSISAWWKHNSEKEMAHAEERLLRRLPSFIPSDLTPDPTPTPSNPHPLVARVLSTSIDPHLEPSSASSSLAPSPASSSLKVHHHGLLKHKQASPRHLHGVGFYTAGAGGTKASGGKSVNVLLHGYGAALGFFFMNLQTFGEASSLGGRRAFALDWLGMGLSSRPSPKAFDPPSGVKNESVEDRVSRAENFFIDSLEEWRKAGGYDTMTLLGHSLGGYLSVAYALKYPERVDKLILISPAGVPLNPEPAPVSAAQQELKPRTEIASSSAADSTPSKEVQKEGPKPGSRPRLRQFAAWAWEQGWSPFGILRGLGPFAPRVVGLYSTRRFEGLTEEEVRDVHSYIYSTSMAKGSGEYCISSILAPGAVARLPMAARMDNVKVPTRFIYGDKDWMDPKGGMEACRRMKLNGNKDVKTIVVPKAGHHIYLDNPTRMNELLMEELKEVRA